MVSPQNSSSMIKRLGPVHRQRIYLYSIKGRSWAEWMNAEAVAGLQYLRGKEHMTRPPLFLSPSVSFLFA